MQGNGSWCASTSLAPVLGVLDESEKLLGGVCIETEIILEQNDSHEDEVLGGGQRGVGKVLL